MMERERFYAYESRGRACSHYAEAKKTSDEIQYIQKLLDSYMAAETAKEEEQLLSEYFSTHRDIPAEWREFSILFRGIRQYEQKPYVSYRRTIIKWSAAAAMIAFVFGIGLSLQHQEETSKPSDAIAQAKEIPTPVAIEPQHEAIAEVKPTMAEITPKPSRPVRTEKSAKQKTKDVEQMMKLLDEADMAFSQAMVQCAIDIEESIPQSEEQEETDCETNIII
ncbi:MAG: hypothetical protein IJP74_08220 [Prevotella sp.]|nr:hypothetical protein [Prevotella sp.]